MMLGKPKVSKATRQRADWDNAWKEALQQLFPEFLQLLFPDIYAQIDWNHPPHFLEQELRRILVHLPKPKRIVDKLVQVQLKSGEHRILLIHVEFQNQFEADLPDRLFEYNIGMRYRLHQRVISLAVLGDEDPNWRPRLYQEEMLGFGHRMRFPMVKLLDYESSSWSVLEQSDNPFAAVVMAHIKGMATQKQPENRLEWKLRIAKGLYDHGYSAERIEQLLEFIDWLMLLDRSREERFDRALRAYEEEKSMAVMSPLRTRLIKQGRAEGIEEGRAEGIEEGKVEGIEKGKVEGIEKGKREAILDTLLFRFNVLPNDIVESVQSISDLERLKQLQKEAIFVPTLDTFRALL